MKMIAPIRAGMIGNPPTRGPKLPNRKLPIQAPTKPAIMEPIMPPGMLVFTNIFATYPMMIAIIILINRLI